MSINPLQITFKHENTTLKDFWTEPIATIPAHLLEDNGIFRYRAAEDTFASQNSVPSGSFLEEVDP